ncbi:LOW QUALITY PROTEIN: Integrase catalytic core protein [Phytophthora palmivora]|uniref:Integrase catalytic core protein n=1 Tax=Phytophthora palmivora TaxID=4796 RepID=A0A2P4YMX1_9STRA|nr:LOW QUALITY PROTEIN: Integrase catalytic core protein [Phytophthora palmivora]
MDLSKRDVCETNCCKRASPTCAYLRHQEGVLLAVVVYVDGLNGYGYAVDAFFSDRTVFSIKDLRPASKFLGMRVSYSEEQNLDQEVAILDMLKEHGMVFARDVRTPIGAECNERHEAGDVKLPVLGAEKGATVERFQSLGFEWVTHCTRPDIAFAVLKASRRTRNPLWQIENWPREYSGT